jgi:DNA-binding MarR family transcriptional regulator
MDDRTAPSRRSPDARQLAAWRSYIETSERLRSVVASRLLAESGLSAGDYAVLLALFDADGGRLRSSPLADAVGWERSRLSHQLGRMEKRGLVERMPSPDDNRGAEVVLTALGRSEFRAASSPHLRAVRELFVDALTPAQLDALVEASEALDRHLAGLRADPPASAE